MAHPPIPTPVRPSNAEAAAATHELIAVLEHQLAGFRTLHQVTARLSEQFAQAGSAALAEGLQQRALHLQRLQESEEKLQALTAQWAASPDAPESRVHELLQACQEAIHQIVELDRKLHRTASTRQRGLQQELAGLHQRRRPISVYLDTTAPAPAAAPPFAGRNVHFSKA